MSNLSILNSKYWVIFSIKVVLVFLLLSLFMHGLLLFFSQQTDAKLSLFYKHRYEFDALTMGTSHSIGFHFSSLNSFGVNFHDGGGDIEEVLFKSNVIMENAPNISTVFIPLSPGSLHFSQRFISLDYKQRQFKVINNLPFSYKSILYSPSQSLLYLSLTALPIFEIRAFFYDWLISIYSNQHQGNKIVESCYSPVQLGISDSEQLLGDFRMQTMKPECIAKFAQKTVTDHISDIEKSVAAEPDLADKNVRRLFSLADRLKQFDKGGLVLVIPPLTREYYEDVRIQKLLLEHNQLLARLAQHANIEVYDFHDYFYEEMDNGSNEYFFDDDHLALPGAIKFSKALKVAMDKRASEASE
jgi:hypothetical protein